MELQRTQRKKHKISFLSSIRGHLGIYLFIHDGLVK